MTNSALENFCRTAGIVLKRNEPMSRHTTFRTGGQVDFFLIPQSEEQMNALLSFLRERKIPCLVLGRGSNLLVSDKGIDGAVVSTEGLKGIHIDGCFVTADAGETLSAVCRAAADNELEGLEFAYGIPGSVGGALYMNAGAYGGEMFGVVTKARVLTTSGIVKTVNVEDMQLSYRDSIFRKDGSAVLSVTFLLQKGNKSEINTKMENFLSRRKEKQPLEFASAGSTFKRPEGYYAGALIEECGLKGFSVGDAAVSEKHAGFVINRGSATSADILQVIHSVKERVKQEKGITLEPEVIFVGRK